MIELNFNSYQAAVKSYKVYPDVAKVIYPPKNSKAWHMLDSPTSSTVAMSLAVKVEKISNSIRKMTSEQGLYGGDAGLKENLVEEIGDVLGHVSALCSDLNISLGDVARLNLYRIAQKKNTGKLINGDKICPKPEKHDIEIEYFENESLRLEQKIISSLSFP